MCEITVVNTHDPVLNEKLWLLLGTLGSPKHPDGWGVANVDGKLFKCELPMFYTTNSGEKIRNISKKDSSPILGHIRNASPRVPVTTQNAHPFQLKGITFVHNGKLTPKVEKDFVVDEEIPDMDDKTGLQRTSAKDAPLFKKVSRSDSLIFFEEFIKDWEACSITYNKQEEKFVAILNETMNKFYGKFAMVFIINGSFYIVRGKTADLSITYLLSSNAKDDDVMGWAVNTSKVTLDSACVLLGNLAAIDGQKPLIFSYPKALKEETIYLAEKFELREIGQVKENSMPIATYNRPAYGGLATHTPNFTTPVGMTGKTGEENELEKVTRQIYTFMEDYSLSPLDIQILLYMSFSVSIREVTLPLLKAFYEKVLVRLTNMTDRKIRKALKKAHYGFLSTYDYANLNFPWMLNKKQDQRKLLDIKKVK